jgi:hypothetical protein
MEIPYRLGVLIFAVLEEKRTYTPKLMCKAITHKSIVKLICVIDLSINKDKRA